MRSIPNAKDPAIVDGDVTVFDWALTIKTMQLGLEAQQVIALRMLRLAAGGRARTRRSAPHGYTFDDAYRSPTAGLVLSGETVKRADLCEAVHQKVGLSRTEAATLVELVLKEIADYLERGETVTLSSFGSSIVRKKGQRIGRNPKTGEVVPISARRVTVFKPSPIFKQRINSR